MPGSVFLNVLAGAIFGSMPGFPLCCGLTAVGASLCYSLARAVGKDVAMDYVPERVERFRLRLEENRQELPFFLLLLQLSPNWALNMASAHWAIRPKKAFATNLLTLLMTLSPSLCSLSFLTSSPSLSVTPSDHRVLSQPLALPIYLNKLSLDDSLHAISSNLGV